jgi:hypothetical protein
VHNCLDEEAGHNAVLVFQEGLGLTLRLALFLYLFHQVLTIRLYLPRTHSERLIDPAQMLNNTLACFVPNRVTRLEELR